jgi:hypothetical protein
MGSTEAMPRWNDTRFRQGCAHREQGEIVSLRDEPFQKGVMYWGYDSNTNRFHNRFFSNNGPYEPAGNEYIGEVTGNALTFVGSARFSVPLGERRPNRTERRWFD